jgi:hypothetical protein
MKMADQLTIVSKSRLSDKSGRISNYELLDKTEMMDQSSDENEWDWQ